MPEPVSQLMREFLTWVSSRPRTYGEAMEAWQTTCPRHTVWEDALADWLIQVVPRSSWAQAEVSLTPRGRAFLEGNQMQELPSTDGTLPAKD
jgi:hypothetical protein